jgi:hypothetical protein
MDKRKVSIRYPYLLLEFILIMMMISVIIVKPKKIKEGLIIPAVIFILTYLIISLKTYE